MGRCANAAPVQDYHARRRIFRCYEPCAPLPPNQGSPPEPKPLRHKISRCNSERQLNASSEPKLLCLCCLAFATTSLMITLLIIKLELQFLNRSPQFSTLPFPASRPMDKSMENARRSHTDLVFLSLNDTARTVVLIRNLSRLTLFRSVKI